MTLKLKAYTIMYIIELQIKKDLQMFEKKEQFDENEKKKIIEIVVQELLTREATNTVQR